MAELEPPPFQSPAGRSTASAKTYSAKQRKTPLSSKPSLLSAPPSGGKQGKVVEDEDEDEGDHAGGKELFGDENKEESNEDEAPGKSFLPKSSFLGLALRACGAGPLVLERGCRWLVPKAGCVLVRIQSRAGPESDTAKQPARTLAWRDPALAAV
jgi:hypothetical protein